MIPFYQVRRWLDVVFRGKLKSSVRELKTNSRVDPEKAASVLGIMLSLGLKNHLQ